MLSILKEHRGTLKMGDLKLSYELDKLDDLVEERLRLVNVLRMKPSQQDNIKLKKQLNKALDLLKGSVVEEEDFETLKNCSTKYNYILSKIPNGTVESSLYQFELPNETVPNTEDKIDHELRKKVRFKDDSSSSAFEPDENHFEPYRDEPAGNLEENVQEGVGQDMSPFKPKTAVDPELIAPGVSNQEIFIQQQQQLLEQDSHLNVLAGSVHRSYNLSLDINQEVTEQNDHVLQDLESLVDNSGRNLDRAKRRLEIFEKSARENGPCFVIVILIIILLFLIIVL